MRRKLSTGDFLTILLLLPILQLGFNSCSSEEGSLTGVNNSARTFADEHWTYYDPEGGSLGSYLAYEYWVATNFGPDGELWGTISYDGTIEEWQTKTWGQKRYFLPEDDFPMELDPVNEKDQYFYEVIGQFDQFGAGWPPQGDDPLNFRSQLQYEYQWTAGNSYRNSYKNLLGGG